MVPTFLMLIVAKNIEGNVFFAIFAVLRYALCNYCYITGPCVLPQMHQNKYYLFFCHVSAVSQTSSSSTAMYFEVYCSLKNMK